MNPLLQFWNTIYNFMDYGFVQDFVSNLLSTILGVAFGIPAALWIERWRERRTENQNRKRILGVILKELQRNEFMLSEWKDSDKKVYARTINVGLSLFDEAWNTLSHGGELQWMKDHQILVVLSQVYSIVRFTREIADKAYDAEINKKMISRKSLADLRKHLTETLEDCYGIVLTTIQATEEELQS